MPQSESINKYSNTKYLISRIIFQTSVFRLPTSFNKKDKIIATHYIFCRPLYEQQSKKPSRVSELILVEQCKNNNRKAQLTLYNKYCDGMFIVAQRYMKNTAAAEDAMQESFIKAFQKLDQFKGNVTFGAWLKRIVINTCIDTIKSYKLETDSLNETVLKIAESDDDWMVHDDTTYDEVISSIEKLPDNYKNVVQLYLLEGYDHQEISEILSISENVSRTNLHRGRSILKEQLNHLQYGTGY